MSKQPKDLTPWQSFFDKEYLGSHNFDDGEEKQVVIAKAEKKKVTKPGGKSDDCLVVSFKPVEGKESVKPMVVNVTNAKAIQKVSGSRHIENWPGTRITLYVDHAVKFAGKTVDGIRVKSDQGTRPQKDYLHKDHAAWNDCVKAIKGDYTIANVRSRYNVSADTEKALLEDAKKTA